MVTPVKSLRAKDMTVTRRSGVKNTFPQGAFELKFERRLTEQELLEFSADNDHLRIEEDKTGFDHVLSGEDVCPGLEMDLKNLKN